MKHVAAKHLLALIVRILHASYRYRYVHIDKRRKAEAKHPRGCFAFAVWHQNGLTCTLAHHHQRCRPLCSRSGDGELMAFLCEKIGLWPVRGSSTSGGEEARRELMRGIEQGYSAAFTVDGPKGPLHKTKPGVVDLARKARVAIVPMAAIADRNWTFNSWDRFRLPKPFAKILVVYADPIEVSKDIDSEQFSAILGQVDRSLHGLESEAIELHRQVAMGYEVGVRSYSV